MQRKESATPTNVFLKARDDAVFPGTRKFAHCQIIERFERVGKSTAVGRVSFSNTGQDRAAASGALHGGAGRRAENGGGPRVLPHPPAFNGAKLSEEVGNVFTNATVLAADTS